MITGDIKLIGINHVTTGDQPEELWWTWKSIIHILT